MSYLKAFLIILFIAMLAPRVYRIIQVLDIGESVVPHTPGKCAKVKGIGSEGSEDIDIIPGTDVVLISSGVNFGQQAVVPRRKGRIMFYDLSQKDGEAKAAKFENYKNEKSLNPHGISVWKDSTVSKVFLFVVNHRNTSDVDVIERFEVDVKKYTLRHLESITDPGFKIINDLTAAGERDFYFTNYLQYFPNTLMGTLENLLTIRNGEVCHYGKKGVTVIEGGLFLPNGINQSPDKRYMYVAHVGGDEIRTYALHSTGGPKLVQRMPVPTLVDNISVDPVTGDLWLGCHPVGWKILHYLQNQETATAPSQVLKVSTKDGLLTEEITEVYVDDGKTIAASSVAVYHKGQLVIGSISHNTVKCDVKSL